MTDPGTANANANGFEPVGTEATDTYTRRVHIGAAFGLGIARSVVPDLGLDSPPELGEPIALSMILDAGATREVYIMDPETLAAFVGNAVDLLRALDAAKIHVPEKAIVLPAHIGR